MSSGTTASTLAALAAYPLVDKVNRYITGNMPTRTSRSLAKRARTPRRSGRAAYRRTATYKKATVKRRSRRQTIYSKRRKTMNQRLTALSRSVKSDQATHIHRRRDVQQVANAANENITYGMTGTTVPLLETVTANLRYYDPSVPGTLTTAAAGTGTYSREIHFQSIYEKLTVRNNYQVPVYLSVYSCEPKHDTNTEVTSFMADGYSQQVVTGAIDAESPLIYPTDFKIVNSNWSLKRMKHMRLDPGREISCYRSTGRFNYNPAVYDEHTLQYQRKYKSHQWVIRVVGVIGHDTVAAEYASIRGAVDVFLDRKFTVTYDAGVSLEDYSFDNNAAASFTNSDVVTNAPIADNQTRTVN